MCDKAVCNDPFMLKHYLNRYKIQKICDKAVDNFLTALNVVSDLLVTSKMIKKTWWYLIH